MLYTTRGNEGTTIKIEDQIFTKMGKRSDDQKKGIIFKDRF